MVLFGATTEESIREFEEMRRRLRSCVRTAVESNTAEDAGQGEASVALPGRVMSNFSVGALPPDLQSGSPDDRRETVLAPDTAWHGRLHVVGDLRIAGQAAGEVDVEGSLRISAGGCVKATVRAENAVISGEFDGRITCRSRLEITATACVHGEIAASRLVVHDGAILTARVSAGESDVDAESVVESTAHEQHQLVAPDGGTQLSSL